MNEDLPTLLVVGRGDPMQAALEAAIARYTTYIETVDAAKARPAAMAAAPDLIVLIGDAAAEHAEAILRDLSASVATSCLPVVIVSAEGSLEQRLATFKHGGVEILPRSPSADFMARKLAELARELPGRSGEAFGELAEASVDELVAILTKELRGGILSVSQGGESGDGRAARLVLKAGRPVTQAIKEFVDKVRPLVAEAKPLQFEFHEGFAGRFDLLDADAESSGDLSLFQKRRVLLIERNPAVADALAQELRANDATVVVADGEGVGLDRARNLGPEIVVVDEQGIETWAFPVMRRIRRDPILRWASVLVIRSEELMPPGEPPRTDRLAGSAALLIAADDELRQRARDQEAFDLRLEAIGPLRMVRALAEAGATLHLSIKSRRASVELDLAEGLIAGALATFPAGGPAQVFGSAAIASLLALSVGRVHVERRSAPATANLLTPIDEAFMTAANEESPIEPSVPPPSVPPPPPARKTSPPEDHGRAAPSAEPSGADPALVTELRSLVSQLRTSVPEAPSATTPPASTAVPAVPPAPKAPTRMASRTLLGVPTVKPGGGQKTFGDEPPTTPFHPSALANGPRQGKKADSKPSIAAPKQAYKPPAPKVGLPVSAAFGRVPAPAKPKPAPAPKPKAAPAAAAAPRPAESPAVPRPAGSPAVAKRSATKTMMGVGLPAPVPMPAAPTLASQVGPTPSPTDPRSPTAAPAGGAGASLESLFDLDGNDPFADESRNSASTPLPPSFPASPPESVEPPVPPVAASGAIVEPAPRPDPGTAHTEPAPAPSEPVAVPVIPRASAVPKGFHAAAPDATIPISTEVSAPEEQAPRVVVVVPEWAKNKLVWAVAGACGLSLMLVIGIAAWAMSDDEAPAAVTAPPVPAPAPVPTAQTPVAPPPQPTVPAAAAAQAPVAPPSATATPTEGVAEAAAPEASEPAPASPLGEGSLAIPTEIAPEFVDLVPAQRLRIASNLVTDANRQRNRGHYDRAIELYYQAALHAPQNGRALAGLTMCYLELENGPEAVRWARAFTVARPEQAGNFVLLAKASKLVGDEAGATEALERAIELEPSHSEARAMLGLAPLAQPRRAFSRARGRRRR